jgi:hypothetical protein
MLKTFTEHPWTQSILQHIVMGGLSLCLVCICYFVLFILRSCCKEANILYRHDTISVLRANCVFYSSRTNIGHHFQTAANKYLIPRVPSGGSDNLEARSPHIFKKESQTYIQQVKTIYSGRIRGSVVSSSCQGRWQVR